MRTGIGPIAEQTNKAVRILLVFGILFTVLGSKQALAINCRVTLVAMDFGVYMPMAPVHVDVNGQVGIRCQAQPGTFNVIIGPGFSGDQLSRTLTDGSGGIIAYNMYRNAARTEIWGDGSPPTFVVSGIRRNRGRPTSYNYTVYGRMFSGQSPNPGVYTDNVVVTVLF
jgi:spore coat protein U-like protein